MTTAEVVSILAVLASFIALTVMLVEKIWGGGRASATQFIKVQNDLHRMELEFTNRMVAMRDEMNSRIDTGIDNTRVGIAAILANQHALEKSMLEFRSVIAEASYVKRPEFATVIDAIRTHSESQVKDMEKKLDAGFLKIENRINQVMHKD